MASVSVWKYLSERDSNPLPLLKAGRENQGLSQSLRRQELCWVLLTGQLVKVDLMQLRQRAWGLRRWQGLPFRTLSISTRPCA